jgi:hypothetical protein
VLKGAIKCPTLLPLRLFRRKRKEGESVCDRFVGEDIFYSRFPSIEPKKYKMVVPYGLRYPPPPPPPTNKIRGGGWIG